MSVTNYLSNRLPPNPEIWYERQRSQGRSPDRWAFYHVGLPNKTLVNITHQVCMLCDVRESSDGKARTVNPTGVIDALGLILRMTLVAREVL